jgi:hypothetical protein
MKDEKDIDSIIRRKLENFSAPPPAHIWKSVQEQLLAQRRKNRMTYIGWISAAAVVVLAFLAGWYFNGNLKTENTKSVKNEVIQSEQSSKETSILSSQNSEQNSSTAKTQLKELNNTGLSRATQIAGASPVISKVTFSNQKGGITNSVSRDSISFTMLRGANARVAQNQQPNTELARQRQIISVNDLTEHDRLLIAENIKNSAAAKPDKNWKMGMFVAPGYSSYNASHSESYAKNMTYSGSEGNTNVSGGFSVQYKTGKRWIVESGVYYAQNGQQSENSVNILSENVNADNAFAPPDVNYFSNAVRVENNHLAMNSTAGVIQFSGTPKGAELSGDFEASKTAVTNLMVPNGEFSQVFEFMEIPLYVRYRLVDSKLGIELLTGLSTGIVVGNNAYIENQYGIQNIGETMDISTFNISGTLGMGVNYALGKHFSVAVEPRFNYYLNSISNNESVEFRPYRIGFYTGVTYEF